MHMKLVPLVLQFTRLKAFAGTAGRPPALQSFFRRLHHCWGRAASSSLQHRGNYPHSPHFPRPSFPLRLTLQCLSLPGRWRCGHAIRVPGVGEMDWLPSTHSCTRLDETLGTPLAAGHLPLGKMSNKKWGLTA